MCARAALWCALALVAGAAAAYTIDCNHEYTDCDTELSKLTTDDEDGMILDETTTAEADTARAHLRILPAETTTTTSNPTRSTTPATTPLDRTEPDTFVEDEIVTTTESYTERSRGRLLNLSVDELKKFALTLHNQTQLSNKKISDLSDVNLDGDDDFEPKVDDGKPHKDLPDKFYSNLQEPFHPMVATDRSEEARDEGEVCVENGISYKLGDRMDRGCEESCECSPSGMFSCSPRCKHPYIRRGRHLNDPLCFESPVDECCSIIACATGNGDTKAVTAQVEMCKYGNNTYLAGSTWNVGCEQRCTCEKNSVVTCKPRCAPLPQSDKCINVQDPNDACCEVQVCDVSQDVHEEQENGTNSTSTAVESPTADTSTATSTMRPLVLTEPIGSIKVLQNNSVQVTLIHSNTSEYPTHLLLSHDGGTTFRDVELKYDNLILNLEGGNDYILKTKETGTKFNFTITTTNKREGDSDRENKETEELQEVNKTIGCHQDGKFYEVGEEFHIGCSELCECTGYETRECAALECPSHVGLELMSKGCVRWAPSPPPTPPNCCPRAARCLSDGTCNYKGVPVPNWTDVSISLTGCEERCFCENGELDCQEVCTPLPPVPPQNLRCPPNHRPAPVNISDEDCCKQWGCVPNEHYKGDTFTTPKYDAAPVSVLFPRLKASDSDFYRQLSQAKTAPKLFKSNINTPAPYISKIAQPDNLTVFNYEHWQDPYESEENILRAQNVSTVHHNNRVGYFAIKPAKESKQSIYKFVQNSIPEVLPTIAPPNPTFQNEVMFQKLVTKSHDNLPTYKLHQPMYFMPSSTKSIPGLSHNFAKPKTYNVPASHYKPLRNESASARDPERFVLPLPTSKPSYSSEIFDRAKYGRYMKPLINYAKPNQLTDKNRWEQNTQMHVLQKAPNPYETVLLRLGYKKPDPYNLYNYHRPAKSYSGLDLDSLLSQSEVETGVNRNLERSADKNRLTAAGSPISDGPNSTHAPPKAPFLPTVPPEIHFPEEEPFNHNNLHRPVNSLLPDIPGLPPGITMPSNHVENKLTVITLMSDSPTSVKMLFGLPPVLVGLRGSVDLRYTDKADEEITHWYSQVFAPADEILTTSRLEFRLTGLKPSTVYKMRGKLYLHNLPVEPESEIYSIRTQDLPSITPVEEKRREIDSKLTVLDVNDTVAHVTWRRFTEEELQFIDAIQVRYRPVGNPIYSMTELLHHSRAAASLHELRPGSRYEASLVLVPPPRATTELNDPTVIEFTTAPYVDPYNWSVQLEARVVGSEAAELIWKGIPEPAERWVRVYRAAHTCGGGRREHDAFRLATRDLPPSITLTGLDADTRCRVWLELFLTNGKVKTSNVLEIKTKSLDAPELIDNVIEASSVGGSRTAPRGDYYGALVVVGVVAALGALTSLLLLLVVVRRHRPRSVPITPVPTAPRESSLPPYDNPAYKLELQQETMDL